MSFKNNGQWTLEKSDKKKPISGKGQKDDIPFPLGEPSQKELMDRVDKGDVVYLRGKDKDWAENQKRLKRQANKEPTKSSVNKPAKDYKYIEQAKGSKLTGGNKGWWAKDKGVSEAGAHVRDHASRKDKDFSLDMDHAKEKHRQTLQNIKDQPKPKLAKEECSVNKNGQWSLKNK